MDRCDACGGPVILLEHRYIEGTMLTPKRSWIIVAPLYYHPEKLVGYCGARCSTEGFSDK